MAKDLHELQESDVIFPDHHHHHVHHHHKNNNTCFDYQEMNHHNSRVSRNSNNKSSKEYNKRMANSLPVNIPGSIFHHGDNNSFEDEEREDEEMVPPHVITGRRVAEKMAFSVCTGNGRTLKGRDLSKVRNSILRMTGFLET
nr:SKI/DACH domain-containing protein 1-like [Quercus suber]